jgi:CRISPR-associated protein Csd2
MNTRKLIVFKHDSALGNAPAHELFDRVSILRGNQEKPARLFHDYAITVNTNDLPVGVEVLEIV